MSDALFCRREADNDGHCTYDIDICGRVVLWKDYKSKVQGETGGSI